MYYIYIVRCADGSHYTGITTDPARRMREHLQRGAACARYTRSHPVTALDALWQTNTRAEASRLENYLKTLPKQQKLALIDNPALLPDLLGTKLDVKAYQYIPDITLDTLLTEKQIQRIPDIET